MTFLGHKPGVAGGGWEDSDEEEQNGHMTRGSLDEKTVLSSEDNDQVYDSRCVDWLNHIFYEAYMIMLIIFNS